MPLRVPGPGGAEQEVAAVNDTGFDGTLTLPPDVVAGLRLAWIGHQPGILADGSQVILDMHAAAVEWDGMPRRVLAIGASGVPLIGMGLLEGYELTIRVVVGGAVRVEAIA